MGEKERMMKLLAANPATLAKVDSVLNGTDSRDRKTERKGDADLRLITYTEAARRLCLSRPTVYRLVQLGRLASVKLNGVSRIRLSSVAEFAEGAAQ